MFSYLWYNSRSKRVFVDAAKFSKNLSLIRVSDKIVTRAMKAGERGIAFKSKIVKPTPKHLAACFGRNRF
jgi:hypothetical protein